MNNFINNQLLLLYISFKKAKYNTTTLVPLIKNCTENNIHYTGWIKPNLESEIEEIQRVSEEENIPIEIILDSLMKADLSELKPEDWSRLENTDSQEIKTLDEAFELAEFYGKDAGSILESFQNNEKLPAPIIIELPNGKLTLVAGNTRLMLSKALGIKPLVLFGKTKKQ